MLGYAILFGLPARMSDSDSDSLSCSDASYDSEESVTSVEVQTPSKSKRGKLSKKGKAFKGKKPQQKSRSRDPRREPRDRRRKRKRDDTTSGESSADEEVSDESDGSGSESDAKSRRGKNKTASLVGLDTCLRALNAADAAMPSSRMQETLKDFDGMGKNEPNVGEGINESLANLLDPTLRLQPDKKEIDKLLTKYLRPGNMPNIAPPVLNKHIKKGMQKGPSIADDKLIEVQTMMGAQLSCILRILDDIGYKETEKSPIDDYVQKIRDAVRLNIWSFATLHQCRRDNIWNSCGYPTSLVCTWDEPVGKDKLFEGDVEKRIKTLKREAAEARRLKQET